MVLSAVSKHLSILVKARLYFMLNLWICYRNARDGECSSNQATYRFLTVIVIPQICISPLHAELSSGNRRFRKHCLHSLHHSVFRIHHVDAIWFRSTSKVYPMIGMCQVCGITVLHFRLKYFDINLHILQALTSADQFYFCQVQRLSGFSIDLN